MINIGETSKYLLHYFETNEIVDDDEYDYDGDG